MTCTACRIGNYHRAETVRKRETSIIRIAGWEAFVVLASGEKK
jgi:hypothetical protein